jgi:hypothetical protein
VGRPLSGQNLALSYPLSVPVVEVPEGHFLAVRVILLSANLRKQSAEQIKFTIAHEVAHAWLGHQSVNSREDFDKQETAADEQAGQWGFVRPSDSN